MDKKDQNPSGNHGQQEQKISHLKQREIQAPVAACLIRGFTGLLGQEKALEVATAAIQANALIAGKVTANIYGGNTIDHLGRFVREVWAEDGAMIIDFLQETDHILSFNVTRCRYAELYEKLGMKELGFCLSCCRDEPFARGFNPAIKLLRTQTIMQGSSHCDFQFILE